MQTDLTSRKWMLSLNLVQGNQKDIFIFLASIILNIIKDFKTCQLKREARLS